MGSTHLAAERGHDVGVAVAAAAANDVDDVDEGEATIVQ